VFVPVLDAVNQLPPSIHKVNPFPAVCQCPRERAARLEPVEFLESLCVLCQNKKALRPNLRILWEFVMYAAVEFPSANLDGLSVWVVELYEFEIIQIIRRMVQDLIYYNATSSGHYPEKQEKQRRNKSLSHHITIVFFVTLNGTGDRQLRNARTFIAT
jgi:hypothetical protein